MTQVFTPEGNVIAVSVIEAGPCVVLQKKDLNIDGYEAVQLGFSDKKESRSNKPEQGHAKRQMQHLSATFAKFAVLTSGHSRLDKSLRLTSSLKASLLT